MDINEFIGSFDQLALASKFRVEMSGVGLATLNINKMAFHCKATTIPSVTTGVIEVGYQGRKVKVEGDRTFEEWTTTILLDESYELYKQLVAWNNLNNSPSGEVTQKVPYRDKVGAGRIFALNEQNETLSTWDFKGVWPSVIGSIEYDWESTDTVQTCPVTFQYNYFDVE